MHFFTFPSWKFFILLSREKEIVGAKNVEFITERKGLKYPRRSVFIKVLNYFSSLYLSVYVRSFSSSVRNIRLKFHAKLEATGLYLRQSFAVAETERKRGKSEGKEENRSYDERADKFDRNG